MKQVITERVWIYLVAACTMLVAFVPMASAQIEEIVVTAQKREQSVQDVPVVVDVVSSETLGNYQLTRIAEMADLIPGFVFSRAPNDNPGVTFRGLGTQAGNHGFDSSIGFFLDGMFLGHQRLSGITIFDIERLEFIKGTQSTLLGKNTSLGAVTIVSRKPGEEFAGGIEVGTEVENGGWFAEAGVDVPINDEFRMRFAGRFSDLDGWMRNVTTGKDVQANKDIGIRVTAVWDFAEGADATATYQFSDNERNGAPSQITDPGLSALGLGIGPDLGESNFDDNKAAFSSDPRLKNGEDFIDFETHLANLTLNYTWNDLLLTSVSSYGSFTDDIHYDFDFDNKDFSTFHHDEEYWQVSQEFRIASPSGGTLEYMAGVFYFKSRWDQFFEHRWGIPDFPPAPGPTGQLFNGRFDHDYTNRTETYSVFGQVGWRFAEQWRLNIGLRYTDETKDVTYGRFIVGPATLWNTVINAPFPTQDLQAKDSFPSGTVSIQYDINDDIMAYVSAARGGKSGGFGEFNTIPCDPGLSPCIPVPGLAIGNPERDAAVDVERTNSYEVGAKMSLLDNSMKLNVAGYWTDVFGSQQLVFLPSGLFVSSNDRIRSRGFEAGVNWQFMDQLRFSGATTFADSEDRRTGFRPVLSPKWSGNAGLTWDQPVMDNLHLTINGTMRHRGRKANQIKLVDSDPAFESAAITQFDASVRLEHPNQGWYVSFIGQNLSNEFTSDFAFAGPDPFVARIDSVAALRSIKLFVGWDF